MSTAIAILAVSVFSFFGACTISAPVIDAADYALVDDYPVNSVDSETGALYTQMLADATDSGFPGFAMLIDGPDGFWAGAGGLADIGNNVAMSKNSLFKIGSVTKTFTAALILDLVEDGLLDLGDPIAAYLPDDMSGRIANADTAQIVHLLNHRSGIPNYYGFTLSGLDYASEHLNHFADFNLPKEDLVSFIYGYPASFDPGEDWDYSNTGYVLLAIIAETVTGKSYAQLLDERICTPLGLDNTHFEDGTAIPGLVRGYDALYGDNVLYDVTDDVSGLGGDGGIISNTYDIATFFRGVFNLSLFGQEQLDAMLTQYPYSTWGTEPVNSSGYALGLFFEAQDGVAEYYAHYGYVYGFGADAYYFTKTDTMVVYLSNMTNNPAAGEKTGPLRELMWSKADFPNES